MRTQLLLILGLAVVLAAIAAFTPSRPPPRVNLDCFRRIERGMVKTDVDALISPETLKDRLTMEAFISCGGGIWRTYIWADAGGTIEITFHRDYEESIEKAQVIDGLFNDE